MTRPNLQNQCPEGTQPCSEYTTAENTVCQKDLSQCPILDIQFIYHNQTSDYSNKGYTLVAFNVTTTIAYTTSSPGIDRLPPTTIQVATPPCSNQYEQSTDPAPVVYPAELMWETCTFTEQTNSTYDPRFIASNLITDDYRVQEESGVLTIIATQPSYKTLVPNMPERKRAIIFNGWMRPTINWSLECEENGTSRQYAYDQYSINMIDFDQLEAQEKFKEFGIIMLSISLAVPGGCFFLCRGSSAAVFGLVGSFVANMVLAGVIMKEFENADKVVAEEKTKLDTYPSLNKCVDAQTQVNPDFILQEIQNFTNDMNLVRNWNSIFLISMIGPLIIPPFLICLIRYCRCGQPRTSMEDKRDAEELIADKDRHNSSDDNDSRDKDAGSTVEEANNIN